MFHFFQTYEIQNQYQHSFLKNTIFAEFLLDKFSITCLSVDGPAPRQADEIP